MRQPVRVPRRMLGGRTCPEVRGWLLYTDRRHQWFTVGPDDVITVVVAPSDANRSSGASQGEGPERRPVTSSSEWRDRQPASQLGPGQVPDRLTV